MQSIAPKPNESKPRSIRDRLWWIVAAPSIWAIHFLACYVTAAIWCEKYASDGRMSTLWIVIGGYTSIAVPAIIAVGIVSFRNFRRGDPPFPYDFDDPTDRTHFLGFTAFLLSGLSLIATAFTVLVFVLVRSCD